MTVTGDDGLEVKTIAPNGFVMGSGVIENGTVTYKIDEGMLRGGTIITTQSANSNQVTHSLVASLYVGSDVDGQCIDFGVSRDYNMGWLNDIPEYSQEFLPNTTGEVIIEYSTGEVFTYNLADYSGESGLWLENIKADKTGLSTAKVRFKNLADKAYIELAQATHIYKLFDDGMSNVGYRFLSRDSRPYVQLKQIPEYLPSCVKNLNCMFWGDMYWGSPTDSDGMYVFESPEAEQALSNWDVSNVETMVNAFSHARFYSPPITNWTPTNLKYMVATFAYSLMPTAIDWDTPNLLSTYFAFEGIGYANPISLNTSKVQNMSCMFIDNEQFNHDVSMFDTNSVTNMSQMFARAINFNQPLNNWNVSSVTDMNGMFSRASSFNQPLGNWDVSNVKNMTNMFNQAKSFNQPLDNWNVSNVTSMSNMFKMAVAFDQPLSNWDVSHVYDMSGMFSGDMNLLINQMVPIYYNQPLSNWDVSNVTNMSNMFRNNYGINQDLSMWNVAKVTSRSNFATGSQLTSEQLPRFLV